MLNLANAPTLSALRPRASLTESASSNAVAAILTPADIILDLDAQTKNQALEEIARFVGARRGFREEDVYRSLDEREMIGSTALGQGVAIPHARVNGLTRPIAAFVRMKMAIPFDAPDGKPVSDLFVLLVPRHATETHLLLLAQVAEMFCDISFRDGLHRCVHAEEVHAAFIRWREA